MSLPTPNQAARSCSPRDDSIPVEQARTVSRGVCGISKTSVGLPARPTGFEALPRRAKTLKRYIASVAVVLIIAGCAGGPRDSSLPIVSQRPALPVDFFPWQKQQPVEIPEIAGAQLAPSKPLRGLLSKPDGEGPFPAVILLHGCSGLGLETPDRSTYKLLRDYAHRYNDRGYVALVLDSYQARGLVN